MSDLSNKGGGMSTVLRAGALGVMAAILAPLVVAADSAPAHAATGIHELPAAGAAAPEEPRAGGHAAGPGGFAAAFAEALRSALSRPSSTGIAHGARAAPDADAALRAFYGARGDRPFWLEPASGRPGPSVEILLGWVAGADRHALPAARYRLGALETRIARLRGADVPAAEAAALERDLSALFLRFARDLSSGALEPRRVRRDIEITPRSPDSRALLDGLAAATDLRAFLAGLAPHSGEYQRQLGLYAELRARVAAGGWGAPPVPPGPTLRPGDRGPRVARLRARLAALGDLAPAEAAPGQILAAAPVMTDAAPATDESLFDGALEAAVRRFQARHGLNTDGVVGPATLAALNVSAAERARQAAVNLERLRWSNGDDHRRHVIINIAAFTMEMVEDGRVTFSTRTVVGKAQRHQTPEFDDLLEFIVVNPKWNVPRSIATEEILPILREDPSYLERNGMDLVGAGVPASLIDWRTVTPATFPGRIVQRPGPGNALGAVKFLFPNHHAIYMHDTPARRLFARDRRDFSHGCVRLEDAVGFAYHLLALEGYDPEETFARLRAAGVEKWVRLRTPIPVHLTYRTAWADETGAWHFRADVYGRDAAVWNALEAAGGLGGSRLKRKAALPGGVPGRPAPVFRALPRLRRHGNHVCEDCLPEAEWPGARAAPSPRSPTPPASCRRARRACGCRASPVPTRRSETISPSP